MKFIWLVLLPIIVMAGLDGKEVYGRSTLDTKVNKPQRHKENPFGIYQSKKQIKNTTKKNLNDLKKEIKREKISSTRNHTKKNVNSILEKKAKKKKGYKKKSYMHR